MTAVQDDAVPGPDALDAAVLEQDVIRLHAEELAVSRRTRERGKVQVATTTRQREQIVDEKLEHQRVEVERVPVGRIVEAFPSIREEGDVTIMPVVEEVVVIERKLLLKEEVRIRRVRVTEQFHQTVVLREQQAAVTRLPALEAETKSPHSLHQESSEP